MLTLLNTRPAHQAKALTALVSQQGFNSLECPALQVKLKSFESQKSPGVGTSVIFISANAVSFYLKTLSEDDLTALKQATLYAIGSATALSLAQQGLNARQPSQSYDSEALLACLPGNLAEQPYFIVKGVGGLDTLKTALLERGASLTLIECYQRLPAPFCQAVWQSFQQVKQPVVLFTSVESAEALLSKLSTKQVKALLARPVIVFSARIEQALLQKSWQGSIFQVKKQSNEGIVECLNAIQGTELVELTPF